ncbi:hypothetical protein I316_01749 [Kwoniella heveanensis BCC8398]|uniref:Asl1-like glycosyl hydrolase catalytic domain-containing protein n=1 Tax=Kwoniella heveanensis BCC8398 TaxID=1296120 RepID=A0A1B9GZQ7_9TREE|nr:hypothetical protein I316_01749 [Kwoniella heveanensis BCC8398]
MTSMISLLNLLPTLALIGMALTGVEHVPGALAHRPGARSPKDHQHHQHLVARHRLKQSIKKRGGAKTLLKRKADGSKCRVRGEAFTASATASSTAAADPTSTPDLTTAAASTQESSSVDDAWSESATASSTESTAPAATSVAAAPASNGGSVNVGSKLGLAWPNGDWAQSGDPNYVGNYIGLKSSWYYTWSPFAVGSADQAGLEFSPMLWGPSHKDDWWAQMGSWPSTVKNALFFNEPNQVGQCDVSAEDAVNYWINDFLPLRAKGIRLGGPAVTNAPSGHDWIQAFQTACAAQGHSAADCAFDFLPVHYYDTDVTRFQEYVTKFHDDFGLNIWVTEYACQDFNGGPQCSDQDTWNFHTAMAGWFDQQSWVERYSPFGVMKDMQGVNQANALMNPDGSITSLGGWYITTA